MRRGADAFANRDTAVAALQRAGKLANGAAGDPKPARKAARWAADECEAKPQRTAKQAPEPVSLMRRLDVVMADALDDSEREFDDELIEGTIARGAMAVLYGDSNSGKTFLAIDIGASVARGVDWLGTPTDPGLVMYLATESPASVAARLTAYMRHHGVRVPGLAIVRAPVNLFDGKADAMAVVELAAVLEREHGAKVALIIGDTHGGRRERERGRRHGPRGAQRR